ncbi:hypothetical protein [Halomarina litorea]|uniref:hypothetical protein n=1 Tax=Halomarina litorea TaxID=2961595 RepID=UPI0020C3CD56|nr:hypothetical protein [Halomarina sp. BCD28]
MSEDDTSESAPSRRTRRPTRPAPTRRRYLAASGAALASALAGCGGTDPSGGRESTPERSTDSSETRTSTGTPEPAAFATPVVEGPDAVAIDETFALSVTVENTGGTKGTYEGAVAVTEGNLQYEEEFEATVAAGSSATVALDDLTVEYADDYTFAVDGTDAETTVSVTPLTASPGESLRVEEGLDVTVAGVTLRDSVFTTVTYAGDDRTTDVHSAPSGEVLAVFELGIENVGTERVTFRSESVAVAGGDLYHEPPGDARDLSEFDGSLIDDWRRLGPSETASTLLVAQIPVERVPEGFSLTVQRDSSNTPPEFEWAFGDVAPVEVPAFELQSADVPEEVSENEEFEVRFEVTNTGAPGTFRGVLQSEEGAYWLADATFEAAFDAGETKTLGATTSAGGFGSTQSFRLVPFGEAWTVRF